MDRDSTQPATKPIDRCSQDLLERSELLGERRLEIERVLNLGNWSNHSFPVLSGSGEKKPPSYGAEIKTHHPHLRLVEERDRFADPLKYDQSTSGRTDSTGTTPPLSRSRAMAVDSAIRSLVDKALRRYPTVVPQRSAYDSCSSTSKELRYVRRTSDISHTLPDGKVVAIGSGYSLRATRSYDKRMSVSDNRRKRLRLLIDQYGSQKALADACGFESDNYISQLLSSRKSFGEKTARKIEAATRKPDKWLDSGDDVDTAPPMVWPFGFDRTLWDRLPPSKQRELENTFQQLILGASVQEAAAPPRRRQA